MIVKVKFTWLEIKIHFIEGPNTFILSIINNFIQDEVEHKRVIFKKIDTKKSSRHDDKAIAYNQV